jgi:hypothetical protein
MINPVSIRSTLLNPLQTAAKSRQTTFEDLVNDWLENQLWEYWHQSIREESERYQAQHAELYPQYQGKVIAMLNGNVVDVGDELVEVYERTQVRYKDVPVFITRVGPDPITTYTVLSPKMAS